MVAFVHKLCPVIPLHKRPQKDMGNDDIHSKGGGGVERGGDPCGRPAGTRRCMLAFAQLVVQERVLVGIVAVALRGLTAACSLSSPIPCISGF